MRREWIEMEIDIAGVPHTLSPSMRREWIEIRNVIHVHNFGGVSLHAEGVD